MLLDLIISRIRDGLAASKIQTDDTPVPMLDPGRGKTVIDRLWGYGSVSAPRALSGGSSLQTSTERWRHSSRVAIDVR